MSRLATLCALSAVAAVCTAATPSVAQYASKEQPTPASAVPAGAVTGARVSGLINKDGTIVRQVGITGVTHVATGEYCISLKNKAMANGATPVMNFNYQSSPDYDVFLAYVPSGTGSTCGSNAILIYTYNSDAGGHTFSDEGFTIVIP